jgi:hypothetical protein
VKRHVKDASASAPAPWRDPPLMPKRLRVQYADGQAEDWPISEEDATRALRRHCVPGLRLQRPSFAFRGLCARPVWPKRSWPPGIAAVCSALEAAFPRIEREVTALCAGLLRLADSDEEESDDEQQGPAPQWARHQEGLHRGVWQKLDLWSGGAKCDVNCARLPETSQLLERLAAAPGGSAVMLEPPGRCYVSLMLPGTRVAPHCGPTNHRLRLHLPILLPTAVQGTLGIIVAGQLRAWALGRPLVFDDSFEHEVALPPAAPGAPPTPRVLLVVDLWHPQARAVLDG